MPFKSKSQMRAAFGGYLGSGMKRKAKKWAGETPHMKSLPEHKKKGRYLKIKLKKRAYEKT